MIYRPEYTKYKSLRRRNQLKYLPYDYESKGLLKNLLPKVITNTENVTTKYVINLVEKSMVFLLKYVDVLKNFKNWSFKQY